MAYIGVQPTDTYLSIASQQITGTGSATYTLNYSVSNEEDVAVFVNNVRQNVSSYTVSGDQLTLGGTISASDECWVLFLGRTVGTKTPAVGSVTNDMLAGSIANAKLANSSSTLHGSAVSLGGSATVGGSNTPAFRAGRSSAQSISNSTHSVVIFNSEQFDTNSAYDTSNGRFTVPVGEGGKYFFYGHFRFQSVNTFDTAIEIHKNGSQIAHIEYASNGGYPSCQASYIGDLAEGDYIQLTAYQTSGSSKDLTGNINYTSFGGFKLL